MTSFYLSICVALTITSTQEIPSIYFFRNSRKCYVCIFNSTTLFYSHVVSTSSTEKTLNKPSWLLMVIDESSTNKNIDSINSCHVKKGWTKTILDRIRCVCNGTKDVSNNANYIYSILKLIEINIARNI